MPMKLSYLALTLALTACSSSTSPTDPGVSGQLVFVTSARQNADFGGVDGADELCASEASAAGLDGEFRAWLSTLSSPVADRLEQSTDPYVLVDGTRIADDWTDLTDGTIQAAIDLDAGGRVRSGDVWTGTLPDGQPFESGDCEGFRSGSSEVISLCGTTQSAASSWTANQTPSCNTELRLFCIEQ